MVAVEPCEQAFESELAPGHLHALHRIGGSCEEDAVAVLDQGEADGGRKMALAGEQPGLPEMALDAPSVAFGEFVLGERGEEAGRGPALGVGPLGEALPQLVDRRQAEIADPESLSVVPLVRNWMPADAARGLLDAALREARRRGLFAPLAGLPGRPVRFLGNLPDRSGEQEFAAVAEADDGPILALATTRPGQGVRLAAVIAGEHAREGMAGLENARDTFELTRESLEVLLGAALAEGLEKGGLAPAGLIDVAVAGGLAELRPRPMTARDLLDELDPEGEIAGLAPGEREVLVEESAAWPGRHPAVEAWSEGTAIYREALIETRSGEGTEEVFWARIKERREGWALTMVRGAYILKSAGDGDWRSFAGTAMALLDGRTLKTVPIMDRIYAETVMAMLRENVGRLSEGDDGTAELGRLTAAAVWPENGGPVAPSIWLDGCLAADVLAPSGARPDALYSAAVERFPDGSGGPGPEAFLTYMTNRYEVLQAQYGETNAVAAMILAADDIRIMEWAKGFAQGVRMLEAAWPTDRFVPEERRLVLLLARLAEGELADLDACADVLTFIEWRWQARYGGGA